MNNIIYTVLLFNLLIILFKLFDKYNVDNLQALTVNYATASIFCYYFLLDNKNINQIINQPWFNSTFFLGCLFIIIFAIYAHSTQKIGIIFTTLANKMSVIIPVSIALMIYPSEIFDLKKSIALFLAIIAIYLCSNTNKIKFDKKYYLLILSVFFGQGILDVYFNHIVQSFSLKLGYDFFVALFIISCFCGLLLVMINRIINNVKIKSKNVLWGIIFGIPNLFSMIFFVNALNELNSSIVYPLVSIGIVASSALLGNFIYKEKLNFNNWLGISIATLSIYLFM